MHEQEHWNKTFKRYTEGKASSAEKQTLDQFFLLQQEPDETIWKEIGESKEQVRARIFQRIEGLQHPEINKTHWYTHSVFRVAATILLVLGVSTLFYISFQNTRLENIATADAFAFVETAPGEQKQVTLPDGSLVHLNSGSKLRYSLTDFSRKERSVYLTGEAFFKVKRDTAHAFKVETKYLTTKVLGTSFNVNTHDEEYAVTVATGLVEVSEKITQKRQKVLLHPSQKAVLHSSTHTLQKLDQVTQDDYAWTNKILVLQGLPLDKAIAKIERWYGVQIQSAPALPGRTITARYENEPIEHVLQSMAFLLDLTWHKSSSGQLILQKQPTL